MRMGRIKLTGQAAVYHCISRIVGGQKLLGDVEKDQFRRLLHKHCEFAGIQLLTFCVMANHFHALIRVPAKIGFSDAEMVQRAAKLYGRLNPYVLGLQVNLVNGKLRDDLRESLRARFGDISSLMKELKQRFSIWYNRRNNRFGTLWAERFKSLVVEDTAKAVGFVARYIDLNPVRAGLVTNPATYVWSGYGEASQGVESSQQGITSLMGMKTWGEAATLYRVGMYMKAAESGHSKKAVLSREEIRKELERGGQLELAQQLMLRIRYFTDGVALGEPKFIERIFHLFRGNFGKKRKTGARPIKKLSADGLATLRNLRVKVLE